MKTTGLHYGHDWAFLFPEMVVKLLAHVVLCFLFCSRMCTRAFVWYFKSAIYWKKTFAGILSNFSARGTESTRGFTSFPFSNQLCKAVHDFCSSSSSSSSLLSLPGAAFVSSEQPDLRKGLQAPTRRYLCIKNRLQIKTDHFALGLFVFVPPPPVFLFFFFPKFPDSRMAIICKYMYRKPFFFFLGKQIWTWRLKFCAFESAYATRMPSRLPLPFVWLTFFPHQRFCLRRELFIYLFTQLQVGVVC